VRLAGSAEESEALTERLRNAEISATAAGYQDILIDFGNAVLASKAVIARTLAAIQDLLDDAKANYTTYHHQLQAQARVPNEGFDKVRTQIEAALHPNFHQEIRYAALTLGNKWLHSYGKFAMILRTEMIENRATLFEENPSIFATRHQILINQSLPVGYRSTWQDRNKLAQAKCYSKLSAKTERVEYPNILMQDSQVDFGEDYVEVHIYGAFNRHSIERVIGPEPKRGADKLLWRSLKKSCEAAGVSVESTK
jgi:hypothetical protein